MIKKIQNSLINAALLILAVLFVIKFAGPSFLKAYVNTGIGDCKKNPVLCIAPDVEITNPPINQDYKFGLIPYNFPKMRIYLPKGFNVVQEEMKKFYYTRDARKYSGPAIYLLYEKPGFFLVLFPQISKKDVADNYAFISRINYAKTAQIKNLTDLFFVVMKSIFTPNLGNQKNIKILKFIMPDRKGYITYETTDKDNYFSCDVINNEGGFFKVYIKDKKGTLDLNKVFTIISTAEKQ